MPLLGEATHPSFKVQLATPSRPRNKRRAAIVRFILSLYHVTAEWPLCRPPLSSSASVLAMWLRAQASHFHA